jgi:hypothetical protein
VLGNWSEPFVHDEDNEGETKISRWIFEEAGIDVKLEVIEGAFVIVKAIRQKLIRFRQLQRFG